MRIDIRPTPAQLADMISTERARRLALGFDYDFADSRGVHRIGTTEQDLEGWSEVTTLAGALIQKGMGAQEMSIDTDTGPVNVSADEWQSLLLASAAFRQPVWAASFVIQGMEQVPQDFADDSYWPL